MFGSSTRAFFITVTLFLAAGITALPLEAGHAKASNSSLSVLNARAPAVPVTGYDAIPNNQLRQPHTSRSAIEPEDYSLAERSVVGAVVDVVKGIAKLITKIVEKVKAKRRLKKAQAKFTHDVVQQGRHDHPEFNFLVIVSSIKHQAAFKGEKGKDWDSKQETLTSEGKQIQYDVYYGREGDFWNNGHKGQVDWAYDGSYEVDRKSKGKHIIFKRPPGH